MISVIVPVYKVEPYLRRCVDSILAQTYTNLEVILVDDGSPDNCGTICDEYASKDSRIKVIHKENGGLSSARNAGIEVATGQYIAFVDSDDWIDADMYEKLLNLLIEHNADVAEGGYRFYRPWKTQNKTLDCPNTQQINVYSERDLLQRFYFGPDVFGDIAVMVWNKIYKACLLQRFRFCEGIVYEDAEFTPRVLHHCKKLVKYDHSFYTYNIRLEPGQISHGKKNAYKIQSAITSAKNVAVFFAEHYVPDITEHTFQRYINALVEGYFLCWENRKDEKCRELKKATLNELQNQREEIEKLSLLSRNWQLRLFFISPFLFCCFKSAYRYMKQLKYRIRVCLTGRN